MVKHKGPFQSKDHVASVELNRVRRRRKMMNQKPSFSTSDKCVLLEKFIKKKEVKNESKKRN